MGFASTNIDLRPIQTRFPWGFEPEALNQANAGNSPDHYAKGTPSHLYHSAPTACRHIVSGSFPPLGRGSFHLSIALLCTIGHQRVFSLAGWTPQIQSRFHVTRPTQDTSGGDQISRTGLSPSMAGAFQRRSTINLFSYSRRMVLQPQPGNPVGLGSSDFARRY